MEDRRMKKHLKKIAISYWVSLNPIRITVLLLLFNASIVQAGFLVEDHSLTASDATEHDKFGSSIAISGDTAVIGAPDNDDSGTDMGSAYVFIRSESGWIEQAKLVAPDAAEETNDGVKFGASVAISGDTAVVGAYHSNQSGAVYVFVRSGTDWIEQAKLVGSDTAAWDAFGYSVAISGDTIAVGTLGSVAAYVFTRNESNWTEQAKLTASDAATDNLFGANLAISEDTIVVGAALTSSEAGDRSGSAYVYKQHGSEWSQQAKLTASDAAAYDHFGDSVDISGNIIVVGASWDDELFEDSGSVYVFSREEDVWKEQSKLLDPDPAREASFGESLALTEDALVVGNDVYQHNGDTWRHRASVRPSDSKSWGMGSSKSPVDLSTSTVIVGATNSQGAGIRSGSAYIFDLDCNAEKHNLPPNQWHQISLPCNPDPNNTVAAVFGDDIPGTYGTDWMLYKDAGDSKELLDEGDSLLPAAAYWIIQRSSEDMILDIPDGSTKTPVTISDSCHQDAKGCFEIPLLTPESTALPQDDQVTLEDIPELAPPSSLSDTESSAEPLASNLDERSTSPPVIRWVSFGYPFGSSVPLVNLRIQTDTGICAASCDLDTAESQGIVHNQLWSYDGKALKTIDVNTDFKPWTGYWLALMQNAEILNPKLLIPRP
jgi:hypothetical protein